MITMESTMTTLGEKLRKTDALARKREEAEVQSALKAMQAYKREKTKKLKNALRDFFSKARERLKSQIESDYESHRVGVVFDLSSYNLNTQEVADELELHTIEHPNQMGNFFTAEIDRSEYLEEFMEFFDWGLDEGIEAYWSFDEDRRAPKDEYSRPRGTYTIRVGYYNT